MRWFWGFFSSKKSYFYLSQYVLCPYLSWNMAILTTNMTDWSVRWSAGLFYNYTFLRDLSLNVWISQESVVGKWSGLVAVLMDYWSNYSWSDQSWPLNHEPSCITITRPRKIHNSQFFLQTPFISSPVITGPACALLVPFLLLGLCYLHFNPSLSLSALFVIHFTRFDFSANSFTDPSRSSPLHCFDLYLNRNSTCL